MKKEPFAQYKPLLDFINLEYNLGRLNNHIFKRDSYTLSDNKLSKVRCIYSFEVKEEEFLAAL